jgi:hypothetical protein
MIAAKNIRKLDYNRFWKKYRLKSFKIKQIAGIKQGEIAFQWSKV